MLLKKLERIRRKQQRAKNDQLTTWFKATILVQQSNTSFSAQDKLTVKIAIFFFFFDYYFPL